MSAPLITFYSFKGGVGRTQALANVAMALARKGHRVIVMDMDMESPGLHAFFGPEPGHSWSVQDLAQRRGLLDFLDEAARLPDEEPLVEPYLLRCKHAQLEGYKGSIRLLLPGRLDDEYPQRIAGFSWDDFYRRSEGHAIMELLRKQLVEADADYVLVDSRTGMTDVAGICTFQLPDIVVALFALHRQGIDGIRQVTRAIEQARAHAEEQRLRALLLLPARVDEDGAIPTREYWVDEAHRRLQEAHGELLGDLYQRIPYEPRMAFGEQIVVGLERSYLSDAYERLTSRLLELTGRGGDAATPSQAPKGRALTREAVRRITRDTASLAEIVGRIRRELRVIQGELQPRLGEVGRALPEKLQQPPEDLDTYRDFLHGVGDLVEDAWCGWRDDWLARFRQALVEAAGEEDDEQIDAGLEQLAELLARGDLEQAKARCDELAAEIPKHSRVGLLQRDALSPERLERSIRDRGSRIQWLEGKLTDAIDVPRGDEPEPRLAVIRNCLRLLVAEQASGPSLWSAYDILCEHSASVADDFASIGRPLWQEAWENYLVAREPVAPDDALPTGKHIMRAQVQTLARESKLLAPLIQTVQQGLAQAWKTWPDPGRAFEALFRLRSKDPVLRAALAELRAGVSAGEARVILGLWLVHGGFDQRVFEQYVHALLEQAWVAEAFFACEAMARRGEEIPDSTWAPAVLGLGVLAARKRHRDVLQALLMDLQYRDRLEQTRAGLLFLAIVAGDLAPDLPLDRDLVQQIRVHVLHESKPIRVEALEDWLRWLEQNPAWDATAAEECMDLERQLNEAVEGFPAHRNWSPGRVYKREFQDYWRKTYDAASRGEMDTASLKPFDVWLDEAHKAVLEAGIQRNTEPNGDAKHGMQRAFVAAEQVIERLLHIGGDQPMPPAQLRDVHAQRLRARNATLEALTTIDDEPPAQDLAALLNAHG